MNNFWKGFCSIFDITGDHYRKEGQRIISKSIGQSLREDFEKIGQDFRNAMNRLEKPTRNRL